MFMATRDGKALNIKFDTRSNSAIFDSICFSAVQSIAENPTLYTFPEGTRYSRSEEMVSLKYAGIGNDQAADPPKLSEKEMQCLMKFSPERIQELLKLTPQELYQELCEHANPDY
jgi:hypothetical protein